ncbi:MAG: caspase family protein, partial [Spirochaetaceae bacterium]|nr:caspase family protein [Spirochaetaceae bacterium]
MNRGCVQKSPAPLGVVILLCFFAAAGPVFGAVPGQPAENSTKRIGLFIGSNNGGRERIMLRYAVSDARAVSRVFSDMGGIAGNDNTLLIEPRLRDIGDHINAMAEAVNRAKATHKRTEIVFYYSGHSDEEGLLLGRERLSYRELRERINGIPSDMRIVILDSCASGAFTRAKGGVKTQPFLLDSSVSAEGYAFLTSSSATEASQESDSIESSYFTHSLVAGLRGAADTIGDGRVTLNEVYRFAYAETLAKTETSVYGAQHPSYDMQVSGTGDVVLTDIKETSASMIIDQGISGRLSIRDGSDYLIAEITKTAGKPMELGLEPGAYRITLQQGDAFSRAEMNLARDQRMPLNSGHFRSITATAASARGDGEAGETGALPEAAGMETPDPMEQSVLEEARKRAGVGTEGSETERLETENEREGRIGEITPPRHKPAVLTGPVTETFNLQLVPGTNLLNRYPGGGTTNNILLGLFIARGQDLDGVGAALIGVSNSGSVDGVQLSGIYRTI